VGAAVGGAIAGAAAIAAGLIAFFVLKQRHHRVEEPVDEEADLIGPSETASTVNLGEDHVFVSEYGLSEGAAPREADGDANSAGDEQDGA
jgi:hypothetical protein